MTKDQFKCYSTDDEDFNHDSFGDLLDAMVDPAVGDVYYEADCKPFTLTEAVDRHAVNSILEHLDERIYEDFGEVYDNAFQNVSQEAKDELSALLTAWAEKHVNFGRFWKIVGKTREMRLTAEDLA